MTGTSWDWQTAWIDVALLSLVVLLIPIGAFMGIRRHAIAVQLREIPDGSLPDTIHHQIFDPLWGALLVTTVALLGIVFF